MNQSQSSRSKSPEQPPKEEQQSFKSQVFISNLPGGKKYENIKSWLADLLKAQGQIAKLVVKNSYDYEYHFAFCTFEKGVDAEAIVKNLAGTRYPGGEPIRIQIEDSNKRRQAPPNTCFNCLEEGHMARNCPKRQRDNQRRDRGRSRSNSDEKRRHRRRRHRRSSSSSSESSRHRDRKKGSDRKKHSKKSRHRSRSKSSSSGKR